MRQKNQRNQNNKLNNGRKDMFQDSSSLSEKELLIQEERKKRIRKRLIVVAIVEVFILMMMSFAWYYYLSHRNVYSEEREVMPPYYLYLVDPNGTDALNLTVGNLHPGETKQIVVGVSNQEPTVEDSEPTYKISKDSQFNYELELAYTQNLPVDYKVYELTKVSTEESDTITVEGKDSAKNYFKKGSILQNRNGTGTEDTISKKNNEEMYGEDLSNVVNLGKYDIYDKTTDGKEFELTTTVGTGEVVFDLDYYLIEIKWQDGIIFSDYLKETDLVYVIVMAKQLEPKESETTD